MNFLLEIIDVQVVIVVIFFVGVNGVFDVLLIIKGILFFVIEQEVIDGINNIKVVILVMLVIRLFYLNVIEIVYGLIRYLINDEVIVGVNNEFFIILVKFIVVFNNVFEM